jgi:hypothetical protein
MGSPPLPSRPSIQMTQPQSCTFTHTRWPLVCSVSYSVPSDPAAGDPVGSAFRDCVPIRRSGGAARSPGAISAEYRGKDEVMEYVRRRRDLAGVRQTLSISRPWKKRARSCASVKPKISDARNRWSAGLSCATFGVFQSFSFQGRKVWVRSSLSTPVPARAGTPRATSHRLPAGIQRHYAARSRGKEGQRRSGSTKTEDSRQPRGAHLTQEVARSQKSAAFRKGVPMSAPPRAHAKHPRSSSILRPVPSRSYHASLLLAALRTSYAGHAISSSQFTLPLLVRRSRDVAPTGASELTGQADRAALADASVSLPRGPRGVVSRSYPPASSTSD